MDRIFQVLCLVRKLIKLYIGASLALHVNYIFYFINIYRGEQKKVIVKNILRFFIAVLMV